MQDLWRRTWYDFGMDEVQPELVQEDVVTSGMPGVMKKHHTWLLVGGGVVGVGMLGALTFAIISMRGSMSPAETTATKPGVSVSPSPEVSVPVQTSVSANKLSITPNRNPLPTTQKALVPTSTPKPTAVPTATPLPTNTPTPTPIPDNEPPVSHILTPADGEATSYFQNGQACVVISPPTDNVNNFNDIQTDYNFDGGSWAGFVPAINRPYICGTFEEGSSHYIQVRSKDRAGNIESPQTRHFIAKSS